MKTRDANQAVEMTGGGKRGKPKAVSLSSHRPWKSPGDSHIPTASTTIPSSIDPNPKKGTPLNYPLPLGSSFDENML